MFLSLACPAQTPIPEPAPTAQEDHSYVLHVYTDLLQIPALVIDWRGVPATNLTATDFKLQLDAGPSFHPTAVHPEANEPLTLALVLDASGAEDYLLKVLPDTPGRGFPHTLLPHDHAAVYAVDCTILRSNVDSASDVATTHDGIAHLLASPTLHTPNAPKKTCRDRKHLLDAIAIAAAAIVKQPGRRAILVISDGFDGGSVTSWSALREFSSGSSIAVFSLRVPEIGYGASSFRGDRGSGSVTPAGLAPDANPLDALVQVTGGTALATDSKHLAAELDRFVALLRSRYILQFPRPADNSGGHHDLEVHVAKYIVYAAGIAVPIRDAAVMNDPNTVPADTSKMPVLGTRKPIH